MKIHIVSADGAEIQAAVDLGICDGVATNPTLIAKAGSDFKQFLSDIVNMVGGPVSAEVVATDAVQMLKEAEVLAKIASNIVIRLPLTPEGLKACRALSGKSVKTNVTLCFNVAQALLAAKSGATFVSLFVGRLEESGENGIALIEQVKNLYRLHKFETKIIAASIHSPDYVTKAALAGADAVAIPFHVLTQLYAHPLTEKGVTQFKNDWDQSGQPPLF